MAEQRTILPNDGARPGGCPNAMTLVGVTGLVDPNARVEIEAEAAIP